MGKVSDSVHEITIEEGSGENKIVSFDMNELSTSLFNPSHTDECGAKFFYAYQDIGLSEPWNDPLIELTPADNVEPNLVSPTSQNLNVDTSQAQSKSLFIQGLNTGKESNSNEVIVTVCGKVELNDPSYERV